MKSPTSIKWSGGFLLLLGILSILAPWIAPYRYDFQNIEMRLANPSGAHWMGTDVLGRDLLSRLLYGSQISLSVGLLTALASLFIGVFLGSVAGFLGKSADRWIMRVADAMTIFPSILSAILISVLIGRGFMGLCLALSLTAWVSQARITRAQVMLQKKLPYIEAARAIGASDSLLLFRHILPNIWGPILVTLTYQVPSAIMAESFLSFLGLGLEPPLSSWGLLCSDGFRAIHSYPHLIIFPGLTMVLTMLAFQWFGDSLRDRLDPKQVHGQTNSAP